MKSEEKYKFLYIVIEELETKKDERGKLVEIFKIPGAGQIFYSSSKPGVTRGGHYHMRKVERFCVVEGKAKIKIKNRETGEIEEYFVSGEEPKIVDMPIGHTHNIENVGDSDMKLIAWVDEVFNPEDPDTYSDSM